MPADHAAAVMSRLSENAPQMFQQALLVASASMNARPTYLRRQPLEKQVGIVRRALSRVAANGVAEELLAAYFLECRKELLVEWLDLLRPSSRRRVTLFVESTTTPTALCC
jgi:hypothetical protein